MSPFKYLNRQDLRILSHGYFHPGFCLVCEKPSLFFRPFPYTPERREYYRCLWCRCTPRYRAFNRVLQDRFPNWRSMAIHESSPGGAMSAKLARFCRSASGMETEVVSIRDFWRGIEPVFNEIYLSRKA